MWEGEVGDGSHVLVPQGKAGSICPGARPIPHRLYFPLVGVLQGNATRTRVYLGAHRGCAPSAGARQQRDQGCAFPRRDKGLSQRLPSSRRLPVSGGSHSINVYWVALSQRPFTLPNLHRRTNEELVMFLSKYRDKNFLKSHGRDNAR